MMDDMHSARRLYSLIAWDGQRDAEGLRRGLEEYRDNPEFSDHARMLARGLAHAVKYGDFPSFLGWATKVERECLGR